MDYSNVWVGDLLHRLGHVPDENRESVLQAVVQETGETKGVSWIPYLSELHTLYQQRQQEKDRVNERWDWLKVALSTEDKDGLSCVFQLLIEAMAKQQGRSWQETCEHPLDAYALDTYTRKMIILLTLTGTSKPQLVSLLTSVHEDIETLHKMSPGTLNRTIAIAGKPETDTLHLHIRVNKRDVEGVLNRIEGFFGKVQTVFILDMPDRPVTERTIYYQQPLFAMPRDKPDTCITLEWLEELVRSLQTDTRVLSTHYLINASDGIEMP